MRYDTVQRLRRIAGRPVNVLKVASESWKVTEPASRLAAKLTLTMPPTSVHMPEGVYSWAFTGNETPNKTSKYYWDQSQKARRIAAEKAGYANLPDNTVFPVIGYMPKGGKYPPSDLTNRFLRNNIWSKPIALYPYLQMGSGPAFVGEDITWRNPSVDPRFSGMALLGGAAEEAEISLRTAEKNAERYKHQNNRYSKIYNKELIGARNFESDLRKYPESAKIHELYGHGATPVELNYRIPGAFFSDKAGGGRKALYLGYEKLQDPRNGYGLRIAEGLGGMHIIKGFWGRRHPDEPLSDNWEKAVEQYRSKGYLDDNGMFTDKLFEGAGYSPYQSTINSLMELYNRRDELLDEREREVFLDQLNWYWPQSNNATKTNKYGNVV